MEDARPKGHKRPWLTLNVRQKATEPMTKFLPSAHFEIRASRRLGLDRCEFDVGLLAGTIRVHDVFQVTERGTLWEWVVLKIEEKTKCTTLFCMNWVPTSGAFVGEKSSTRRMKAPERKRYAKYLQKE